MPMQELRVSACSLSSILLAAAMAIAIPRVSTGQESTGDWVPGVTLAPYAWLAGFDGTVGVPSDDLDPGDGSPLPDRLDVELDGELEEIGFMFYADWRGQRWMAFFDSVWVNASQAADVSIGSLLPGSSLRATIDGNVYTLAGGFRLKDWDASTLLVYAGPRYYDIEAIVEASDGLFPEPVRSRGSRTWTDAIAGLRFSTRLGEPWTLTLSADAGGASSTNSQQASISLSYRFERFAVVGGYRYLAVDYERDDLLMDVSLAGPLVGLSARF